MQDVKPHPLTVGITAAVAIAIALALVVGAASGCRAWMRYQARAEAENQVKVTQIQIRNQAQRVEIARQRAQIRRETAAGVRDAQAKVATTLTPLFVQYEMIEALKAIAASGHNNSVVYIPAGANGVPLVSVSNKPQVFEGQASEPGK